MLALLFILLAAPLEQAQALEAKGDDGAAIAVLSKAVASDPLWAIGRVELGRLQLKRGEAEAALHQLDVARSLAFDNPRAHYLFALAAADTGRHTEAKGALEVALSLREGFADAQLRLATMLDAEGDTKEALRLLKAYRATHEASNGQRLQYASLLERSGEPKAAEAELRALMEVPALRTLVARRLIALLEAQGRAQDAQKVRNQVDPPKRQLRELKPSRR